MAIRKQCYLSTLSTMAEFANLPDNFAAVAFTQKNQEIYKTSQFSTLAT